MRRAAAGLLSLLASHAWGGEVATVLPGPEDLSPLVRAGEVARHTPDSLWESINGQAELYRRFGVVAAALTYYAHPENDARGLEVSVFQLAEPLGAFGVWATYRPQDATLEPLGNGGFRDSYQAAFWHGPTFVLLQAFGDDAERAAALAEGLAAIVTRLGPPPPRPPVLAAFETVAAPHSVQYRPDHLLGRGQLPPGLEGETPEGTGVFVATRKGEDDAALEAYRGFLGDPRPVTLAEAPGWAGSDPNLGPVTVVIRDGVLAGARAAAGEPGLAALLAGLLRIPGK